MKYIIAILSTVWLSITAMAQDYKPIDKGSTVEFVIKNLGFNTKGTFSGLDGRINFDAKDEGKDSFDVSIDASSVNTDNEMRDGHLKKEAYFDVEKYPRIRLVSTSVSEPGAGGRRYIFNGKLTIKDKTRDISFPFTATQVGEGYLFKGSFSINRRDFEVGGGSTISNNLTVNLTVVAQKQ